MDTLKTFSLKFCHGKRWDLYTIRWDSDEKEGLDYTWLCLSPEEFEKATHGSGIYQDGYHHAEVYGDTWMFYRLEIQRGAGSVPVKYRNIDLPRHVLQDFAKLVQRKLPYLKAEDEILVEYTQKARARLVRLWGQGKGKASLDMNEETAARFDEHRKTGGESFERCIEHLKQMAKNQTTSAFDTGVVRLWKDWDGYFWELRNMKGDCVLHGGLINHGKDGAPDWSLHT